MATDEDDDDDDADDGADDAADEDELIIIAASSAYRNDSVRDLDLSVQRLLSKWGNRVLKDLRGCRSVIVHIEEAEDHFRQRIPH